MSERTILWVAEDVLAPELQLHVRPGAGVACALFGWDVTPVPIDAGPPQLVEEILAHALVHEATVAFLHPEMAPRSSTWESREGDLWLHLPAGLVDRLRGRVASTLVATRRPERARDLFDCAGWSLRAQVGLLLPEGTPPIFGGELLRRALDANNVAFEELQMPAAIGALVFPAVDGDYLELVARTPALRSAVREAVRRECEARGVVFEVRSSWR